MKFNLKVIVAGGLAMYVAQFILGMVTGQLIHEGVLAEAYKATSAFWRPELNQDPPDMAALMPRWIAVGIIAAFILAGIYDNIRAGFSGPGLVRGAKYGVVLFLVNLCVSAGWSGVFNLPDKIWVWWNVEAILYYVVGAAVLGLVAAKLAPEGQGGSRI